MRHRHHKNSLAQLRLAWMLAKRDLKNRYASSYAGVAWNIGVPLLYSIINVLVFSILMSGKMGAAYGNIPFAMFYFVPLSLWTMFAEVVGRAPTVLREYSYLINKIAFPAWVLPLVPLASALLSQAIILLMTIGLAFYLDVQIASTAWLYIVIWMISLVITMGVAYAVASLSVYVPDMVQAVPVGITILFWLTPILYPATLVREKGAIWLRSIIMDYNPFYYVVDMSRHAVFGSAEVRLQTVALMALVAALILAAGVAVFRKLQPGFADVI
jgi:ABC-type polysaccharide/polyol phosphate export permease